MNRERLQMVRDRIATQSADLLDMSEVAVLHPCGTAHCIAGWASKLAGFSGDQYQVGVDWMELSDKQADRLCLGEMHPRDIEALGLTQADALAALDSLINADSDDALPVWPEPRA